MTKPIRLDAFLAAVEGAIGAQTTQG